MHKKQVLNRVIITAMGSLLLAQTGFAQDYSEPEEIIIFGTQSALDNISGSRLNLSVLETPASVDIIDGDAIRERIDTSVLEAVTRSAGFVNEANPGNGHFSIQSRGFSGQGAVTKLYDGSNYFTIAGTVTFPFDTWGVERIEVLKGPSSVLYGEGGIGGAINIIPRRPEFENSGDVRVMVGENSTAFFGIDYTGRLTDSTAFRVDYSHSESDNWVNNGESEADMLSLALLWEVNDDLSITARYDFGDQEPMKYFGTPIANGDFIDSLVGLNFNVGDAAITYEDSSFRIKADWNISAAANLQAEVYQLDSERYWRNAEGYVYDDTSMTVSRWDPLIIGHDVDHTGFRTNLTLSPENSRLKTSVGVEGNDIGFVRPSNFGAANPNPIDWGADTDTVDPFAFNAGTLADLTDAPALLDNWADVSQWAVFGEAQYSLTENLALVGALRYDDFDTRYQRLGSFDRSQTVDVMTGRIGAVYDLNDNTALYAQYGTGASHPSSTVVTISGSHREADLVESEQIEIGIKNVLQGTGLQWSVALFDISKNNLIEDDPDSADPNDVIVIPQQTSRGIELGMNYALTDTFQVHGNLAALNAETSTGETPSDIAETTWNFGFVWDPISDLSLIADARYVDERYHASRPMHDYTVVDASAHWAVNDDLRISLKADNLFDELYASGSYWWGTWIVGKPRTLSLALDYSF